MTLNNSVISQIHKPMSGYNYFISMYISRSNRGLPPYKLPDGTLFDGGALLLETGDYLLLENGDRILL